MPESSKSGNYAYTGSGTNRDGNHWCARDYGDAGDGYHYSNSDGSYFYKNPNGSKFYNSGTGFKQYTSPSGETRKSYE